MGLFLWQGVGVGPASRYGMSESGTICCSGVKMVKVGNC